MNTSTKKDNPNQYTLRLAYWTLGWVLSVALVTFGPENLWESTSLTIIAIVLNVAIGAGMILMNRKFIKLLDELQRKIQLEAMGIALGVAVVIGLAYDMLADQDILGFKAEISHLVILISCTYLLAIFIGNRKYA